MNTLNARTFQMQASAETYRPCWRGQQRMSTYRIEGGAPLRGSRPESVQQSVMPNNSWPSSNLSKSVDSRLGSRPKSISSATSGTLSPSSSWQPAMALGQPINGLPDAR